MVCLARACCSCCCCRRHRDKSTSHTLHCKQVSVEEASTTTLLKEQTRIKTMGFPRKVSVKGFARPLSSTAAAAVQQGGAPAAATGRGSNGNSNGGAPFGGRGVQSAGCIRSPTAAVSASALIDTQKSKVPLKWAASNLVPPAAPTTPSMGLTLAAPLR
jgi:hypothetical protein